MKLTANFNADEFDVHEPWPAGAHFETNRLELARRLQWLRDLAGVPVIVTSAYRSETHNAEVGGSPTSQHPKGEAVDAVTWLIPLRSLAARVLADVRAGRAPAFGQIIFYPVEGHTHLSLPTLGARNGEIRWKRADHDYPFLHDALELPLWSAAQRRRGLQLGAALVVAGVGVAIIRHALRRRGSP